MDRTTALVLVRLYAAAVLAIGLLLLAAILADAFLPRTRPEGYVAWLSPLSYVALLFAFLLGIGLWRHNVNARTGMVLVCLVCLGLLIYYMFAVLFSGQRGFTDANFIPVGGLLFSLISLNFFAFNRDVKALFITENIPTTASAEPGTAVALEHGTAAAQTTSVETTVPNGTANATPAVAKGPPVRVSKARKSKSRA